MTIKHLRIAAAAAALSLTAVGARAAEPDFAAQLNAGQQTFRGLRLAQARLAEEDGQAPGGAEAAGAGVVSSEEVAVVQNPGSQWYYAYVPVAGDVALAGPGGLSGTIRLTGLLYVSGAGWGGTGPGAGAGTVSGIAELTDGRGRRYEIAASVDVKVVGQAVNGRIKVSGPAAAVVRVDAAADGARTFAAGAAAREDGACALAGIEGRSCVYRCGPDGRRRTIPVEEQPAIAPGAEPHPYCPQFVRAF
jgi:hypothetical protein